MGRVVFQEADFYGAASLIFGSSTKPACFSATWMHGLGPVFFRKRIDPNVLIHFDEFALPIHLGNNRWTQSRLEEYGIQSKAVGMPILYADNFNLTKQRDIQRLYMPAHIIGKSRAMERIQKWSSMLNKYGCDAICLSKTDFDFIKKRNIDLGNVKILEGAHPKNEQSLENMCSYFNSCWELITDSSGSHIPYATAMGVHIPITEELCKSGEAKSNVLSTIPIDLRSNFEKHMRFNPLQAVIKFWGSSDNQAKIEYSQSLLGLECVKEKEEIKGLLAPASPVAGIKSLQSVVIKKIKRKLLSGL